MADGGSLERRTELRESAIFRQRISERTGERGEIHKKTFLKWMNAKLANACPPLELTDLIEEVRDGHALLSLLEVLLGNTTLQREKGRMRLHKLNNVATALKLLEKNGVKLVGISNYDIVDGKSTPILGLIWSIILRFQVQEVMEGQDKDSSLKDYHVEKKLLSWCETSLEGYEDVVKLKDFTSSWRDGMAFNAIIHSHKPELFRFESLLENDNRTNLEHAFTVAHDEFSVPKLLDPVDIDVPKPDKKLIVMYITSLYHGLRGYTPQGKIKRRKLDDLGELEEYRAALKEINLYITKEEEEISSKLETTNRFANPVEEYRKSKALLRNISSHRDQVEDVADKGQAIVSKERVDEIRCTEIKNEIAQLHDRWEKLNILAMRFNKRCRGAVLSPREQQIDVYITWIRQMRTELGSTEPSTNSAVLAQQIKQHEETLEAINRKQPQVDRVVDDVNELCSDSDMEDDDRSTLQERLKDLYTAWEKMKEEALKKKDSLQERLSQAPSDETDLLVSFEQQELQSSPSETSPIDITPSVEPDVHYLIDFEDGPGPEDTTDSRDRQAEKDAKIAHGQEKRNAVFVILEKCSSKLHGLRSRGAPTNLNEVKDQQMIVEECDAELKACAPDLQSAILYGREMTQDDLFDDDEKDNITRGMAQLQQSYDDLRNFVDDEKESLDDLYKELEKRDIIHQWEEKRNDVGDKLEQYDNKLRRLNSRTEYTSTEELLAKVKECSEEINALEPEVNNVVDGGNRLIRSGILSDAEGENVAKDGQDIENSYKQLKLDGVNEVVRLEALLLEQSSEKQKLADRIRQWQTWRDKLNSTYKKVKGKFTKVKGRGIPKEQKKVVEQLALTKECSAEISEIVPELQEAFGLGNELIGDKSIDRDTRTGIEKEIQEIGEGFKGLKLEMNDYENQLEDLSAEQEKERLTKIEIWKTWVIRIREMQTRCQVKMAKLKAKGEPQNRADLDEQSALEKECREELESCAPTIREGLDYGRLLLDDEVIDDDHKAAIQKERNQLLVNQEVQERDNDDQHGRLEVLAFQYDTDKQEKLRKWETWKIKLKTILVMREESLNKLKSHETPDDPKLVEEQLAMAKECEEGLLASEPEIKFGLDYGEQLLDDDVADLQEKERIQEDVDELERVLNDLKNGTTKEKIRLHTLYVQQNKEKGEKLQKWKIWTFQIRDLQGRVHEKMKKLESCGEPQDKEDVEKQIILASDCKEELQSSKRTIEDGLIFGRCLLKDNIIDDDSKANIGEDLREMQETQIKQEQDIDDGQKRLEELLRFHEEHGEEGKMKTWKLWVARIRELLGECDEKLAELKSKRDPQIRKEADEQIVLTKEFNDKLVSAKPEISDGLGYGSLLLDDGVINDDNKATIRQDIHELERRLQLLEQANADGERRYEWLILLREGKEEEQKLKRWEIWMHRINQLMEPCESKLQHLRSKGDPHNKAEVEEQVMLTNECNEALQLSKPEVADGLAYGWFLLEDNSIRGDNKTAIRNQLNILEDNLLRLEQANASEQRRLEWLALLYQGKEKEQKLKRWQLWYIRIKELMNQSENKLMLLKSKGDPENREEIEEQMILTKKCRDELDLSKPEINEGLTYGWRLVKDGTIDDSSREMVRGDISQLEGRLSELEHANDGEQRRMEWLALLLQGKEKEQKLKRWEIWTILMEERLGKCDEKLENLKSKGDPKDEQDAKEKAVLEKEFRDELEFIKPEIHDGLAYGRLLLEDDVIDNDNKAIVRNDLNRLEEHFLNLEQATGVEKTGVVTLEASLESANEDTLIMEVWREKFGTLKNGFDAAEIKIEQGKKAKNSEEIEKSYKVLKDLTTELAHTEPEVMKGLGYGKALASDDTLISGSRREVAEDMMYLQDRWKTLMKQSQDEYARLGVQLGASQAKQRNLATWYEQCDELNKWVIDRYQPLRSRPASPESSFGGIKRQQSVIEDLVKDIVGKQTEVNTIIDEGNEMIEDESILDGERKRVHDKMQGLHDNWNKLALLVSGKQQSVKVLLLELEQEHLDKTQRWRRKVDPLTRWINSAETKLNTQFAIAPDLDTVKKQKIELEDFNNEMLSHQREVSDTLQTGDKLLKDPDLPEDDRTGIQKEVLDISHRWENLEELVSWKGDRIDDTIRKLKKQQEDKLEKWHEGVGEVNTWMAKTSVKVESQLILATDIDAALEQVDSFQEVIKDAPLYQEKVTFLNEFSSNLVSDPCLGEEERTVVRQEIALCNKNWNALVNRANARQARMEENLNKLERQQQDVLELWKIRSERAGLALDKLEGQISIIDDPIGTNLEAIRRQEDSFELFSNEVELNTRHMIDTLAVGEKVRRDPKLTTKIRDDVQGHLNSLSARWDRVKDFAALRKERLDEASKRLQRDRRNKLQDWEERLNDLDSFLRKAEREAERLERIGDDLDTVRQQSEDYQGTLNVLLGQQKRIYNFGKFTDDLLADPAIDEKSKRSMRSDKEDRIERWERLIKKLNNHQTKLQDKLKSLEKSEEEISEWDNQLVFIQDEMVKIEGVCDQESAPDLETLEKQKEESKNLKFEVKMLDPKVVEFLKTSDDLIDGYDLPEADHRRIERESDLLRDRWDKLKADVDSREPRIEEKYLTLQQRQDDLLNQWKVSSDSTIKWITDTTARVQSQDSSALDLDDARAQRQEIEDIMGEIKLHKKHMNELDDLGNKVAKNPSLRESDKKQVISEKASVFRQWDGLSSKIQAVRDRLDGQIAQLEKEQRDKLKVWTAKTEPLETWLVRNEAVIELYEPIGYDINNVRRQKEDAQTTINELLHEQPKFAEVSEFGNQLTREPCVGLEERVQLQKEMRSLHERWDTLYGSATTRHDRIQDRLKILEEEQRKMEEERKRLEEEERQRQFEEERRRKEEAERRRIEEEERIRKEEEERRRREQEERKRREEEERKQREEEERRQKEEEEERKRREEEKRKRREEEERRRRQEEERRRKQEEERKQREEEERRRREEEKRKRREEEEARRKEEEERRKREQERKRKEEEERRRKEEEERKRKEEQDRKRREEERRKKEEERKRKEEEEARRREERERERKEKERKRKEDEERREAGRKRREEEEQQRQEEKERQKAHVYIAPEPTVQLVQQEPRLFTSPADEVLVTVAENGLESTPNQTNTDGERACEQKLAAWKDDVNEINRWLSEQEDKLKEMSDDEADVPSLKEQEKQILSFEKTLPAKEEGFHSVEKEFGDLMGDPFIREEQQEAIGEEMDNLRVRWRSLCNAKDARKKRLQNMIWNEEQKKANELAGCRVNLQATRSWIDLRDQELDSMDPIANDLETLTRQKEEAKNFTKRIHDYEPRFTEATDVASKLCEDPDFSEEQKKSLQQDVEKCEQRWDDVLDKAKDRMDGIIKKIPGLQKHQRDMMDDWKDMSSRFEKTLKKTEGKLEEQASVGKELGYERWSTGPKSPELVKRAEDSGNHMWKPMVDDSNKRLQRFRERLQAIQREKKNRKWSIIEALKDVVHSISSRFRREPKPGIHLDKVIDLLEEHEDIMSETSSRQKDADEVFAFGVNALESGMLDREQVSEVHDRMTTLGRRWNHLNVDIIEREERLEQLAQDLEGEYEKFDNWRDRCENMNQWLSESERLIRNEEKIGSEIDVLQVQIKDNQLFLKEVKEYEPKVEGMIEESQEMVERNKLDKADIDGVDKTKNALIDRWEAVNKHLNERQDKLDAALVNILKRDTDNMVGRWRDKTVALGLLITDAKRKVDSEVDDTDFGDIQIHAVELQEVESSLGDDFSKELLDVTDSAREIMDNKTVQPDGNDEMSEILDALNRQIADLERGTRDKKDAIKEASLKYFGRSLANCERGVERLDSSAEDNFSDVGADIEGVGKQLIQLQDHEANMVKEEAKFSDVKAEFADSEGTRLLRDEDRVRVTRRIGALDDKWAKLNKEHNGNKRKLVQAMMVYHEELMEEVYDWMSDTEKQADSIVVDENDINSVVTEYGRHKDLKEEISSFEPTFRKAIAVSDRLLTERLVDPERAETYEDEINTLEKRWEKLQLKTMDNGAKLSGSLGRYLTIRLDDAEVKLTRGEAHLGKENNDYLDLEAAKRALDSHKVNMNEINASWQSVQAILSETRPMVQEGFIKDHERDHFEGRIDRIEKRNGLLGENVAKEHRRLLDTYLLLLKQHMQRMNIWLGRAESRMKSAEEIGPGYDNVKRQLEEHQGFQEELRDHSMITMILELDITEPTIGENVQEQVRSLSDRWSKVWNWSEKRKTLLLRVLSNWQRFRDEQLILLNWLSNKEKLLKDMGRTDLSDEEEVQKHLETLRSIEKELDEQGIRLQSLHTAGEELLKKVDDNDPAAKEIHTQLKDFDDCWNDIAKQVISKIQQLESSQSKLNEFHSEMDVTNEWMDDTEKILKSFAVGMDPEEASKLQEKTEIKCEERPRFATKVERINRLGKDLAGEIDQPSHDAIQEELEPFNARWSDISSQLENFSDKGYQPNNDCCLVGIMRRKFGFFQ